MKKIMYSRRFGLQQAVLDGSKTMTRRIVKAPRKFKGVEDTMLEFHRGIGSTVCFDCVVCDADGHELGQLPLPYEVGDVVAVSQSYREVFEEADRGDYWADRYERFRQAQVDDKPGWYNKMFVKAELMPNRVQITNLWFERLQDISDEDCMREGIKEGEFMNTWDRFYYDVWGDVANHITFKTPRQAFASLFDRISGRGTWDANPWVVVYTQELVK